MTAARAPQAWRLVAARAAAWALLLSGWGGIGAFAQVFAPNPSWALAIVALWLLMLGLMAAVATHDGLRAPTRRCAVLITAAAAAFALPWSVQGGGVAALLLAVLGWSALAALASGVVRSLRWARPLPPGPPIGAACLGALAAGVALDDLGDVAALAQRLAIFVAGAALLLAALQPADATRPRPRSCRAGLFDCSLPAWPSGAWNDLRAWPTMLAGLAMLPAMAALPLMASLCRAASTPPQAMVLLHFAAMFLPALLMRRIFGALRPRLLAGLCAACLAAGAACALWAPQPLDVLGLVVAQGAAWGLAWSGQLWSPERRGAAGASPVVAALGYAALTAAIGVVIDRAGVSGITGVHAALGALAAAVWLAGLWRPAHDAAVTPREIPRGL